MFTKIITIHASIHEAAQPRTCQLHVHNMVFMYFLYPVVGIIKYGVEGQTGFTQLSSIINCSNIIQFECVSTGPGTTEFMIGNDRLFGISHSLYEGGANTDDIWLNGDVRLTNLSVSAEMECLNLMELPDSCYTMVVEVRLTEQTLCKVFSCRTVLFNGSNTETNHGTATASRGMCK